MKLLIYLLSTTLLFTTIFAATLADLQSKLPECSLECLASGAAKHGCQIQDFTCLCSKIELMIKTVSPCLVKAGCQLEDITDVAKVVFEVCQEVAGNMTVTDANSTASATQAIATTPSITAAATHLTQSSILAGVAVAAIGILFL